MNKLLISKEKTYSNSIDELMQEAKDSSKKVLKQLLKFHKRIQKHISYFPPIYQGKRKEDTPVSSIQTHF